MSIQKKITLIIAVLLIAAILFLNIELNEVGAGIAILLIGILFIEEGFKLLSNGPVEKFLEQSTKSLFRSINFGFITAEVCNENSFLGGITMSFLIV